MAYVLVWTVAVLTAAGINGGSVQDSAQFKSEKECVEFGEAHKARMEDWTRGRVNSGWDTPVHVEFSCTPAGRPA